MHPVLARQLRKLGLTTVTPPTGEAWAALLRRVGETYEAADQDRTLVDRSLEVSSREMADLTAQLQSAERTASAERDQARASEERYRSLVELSPVGVVLLRDGLLDLANPAALQLLVASDDVRPGVPFGGLVAPESRRVLDRLLDGSAASADDAPGLLRFPRPDGGRFEVEAVVSDVRGPGGPGGVGGVLLILHDLSARREAERRLRESEEGLRRTEQHLRQAQKMEAVGRLAGGVAHDFNNILTVILGYGELIQARLHADDPVQEPLRDVISAGERAKRLTGQLLAFSRRRVVEATPLDVCATVRDLLPMLGRLLGEDVVLSAVLPDGLGCVLADRSQIEQVVMNLVVNARDAMPGGGRLTLSVRRTVLDDTSSQANPDASPGPHVVLSVTDTGCGMEKSVLDHLFEPFFTTKAPDRGTGLGLSTVYGVVRQAGGHLSVYSELGRGTTFKVYLPLCGAEAGGPAQDERVPALPQATGTVLLVEDDPSVRRLAQAVLTSAGLRVLACGSADEALAAEATHGESIHVLLTDVVMPLTSGPDLARGLRQRRPGLPVIFMSGYAGAALSAQGALQPGDLFLDKPFTPGGLLDAVRRARTATDVTQRPPAEREA